MLVFDTSTPVEGDPDSFWYWWDTEDEGVRVGVLNPRRDHEGWWVWDALSVGGREATADEDAEYAPAIRDDLGEMQRWA